MIGEEYIVEVYLSSLLIIDKVSVGVVDAVEQEAGKVHSYEIEIHSLYTMSMMDFTF